MPATKARKPRAPAIRASRVERTDVASSEVFKAIEAGQRAALSAVRKFVATVDDALPGHGEEHSRSQEIIDAALQMSERLVHVQYDFLRNAVHSAGEAVRPGDE